MIENRVQKSPLKLIELSDIIDLSKVETIDIMKLNDGSPSIKEKEFKEKIYAFFRQKEIDGKYFIFGTEMPMLIPLWFPMFLGAFFKEAPCKVYYGTFDNTLISIYKDMIEAYDVSEIKGKPVIIPGCSKKFPFGESLFLLLSQKLSGICSKLSFGEACSAVPIVIKPYGEET